jgi:hypothetical protein
VAPLSLKPARGSLLWYAAVIPRRLRLRGVEYLRAEVEYRRLRRESARQVPGALRPGAVTVLITSAGRVEYLEPTIRSLRSHLVAEGVDVRWVLIDDDPSSGPTREYLARLEGFDRIVLNERNRGLGHSLNAAYSTLDTEYVFHCEDDWLFLRDVPLARMIASLAAHPELRQLLLFREAIHAGEYPDAQLLPDGIAAVRHKFSFNPHLARASLYVETRPFPLAYTELEWTLKLERRGQRVSGVWGFGEAPFVRHIGIKKSVARI